MKRLLSTFLMLSFVLVSCADNWLADQEDDHSVKHCTNTTGFPYVNSDWRPATEEEWEDIYLQLDEPRGYTYEEWMAEY